MGATAPAANIELMPLVILTVHLWIEPNWSQIEDSRRKRYTKDSWPLS